METEESKKSKDDGELRAIANLFIKRKNSLTDAMFSGNEEDVFQALENLDNMKNSDKRVAMDFLFFCHFPHNKEIFRKMAEQFTPEQRDYTFVNLPEVPYGGVSPMEEMINLGVDPNVKSFSVFLGYDITAAQVALRTFNTACLDVLKKAGVDITKATIPHANGFSPCGRPIMENMDAMTYALYASSNEKFIKYIREAFEEKGVGKEFFESAQRKAEALKEKDAKDKKFEKRIAVPMLISTFPLPFLAVGIAAVVIGHGCFNKLSDQRQDNKPSTVLKAETTTQDVLKTPGQMPIHVIKHSSSEALKGKSQGKDLQRN